MITRQILHNQSLVEEITIVVFGANSKFLLTIWTSAVKQCIFIFERLCLENDKFFFLLGTLSKSGQRNLLNNWNVWKLISNIFDEIIVAVGT